MNFDIHGVKSVRLVHRKDLTSYDGPFDTVELVIQSKNGRVIVNLYADKFATVEPGEIVSCVEREAEPVEETAAELAEVA